MRIAANPPAAPPPLALNLPASVLAAASSSQRLDQATLLQVAAIAASTPWSALDQLVSADRSPLPVQVREALLTAISSLPNVVTSPSTNPQPLVAGPGSVPVPAVLAAVAADAAALAATISRDRLSLSPTVAALRTDPAALQGRPTAEFMLNLLVGLTGEPPDRLQLLAFGAPGPSDNTVASLAAKGPGELLQLLVRGTVHSADAKLIEVTLGLSVQRQPGSALLDGTVLDSIRATVEALAQMQIDLDYPGAAAGLAGHSARFQAVLDPLGLWPMQSFVLSGLLILGRARDDDEDPIDDLDDQQSPPDRADEQDMQEQGKEPPPRPKRKKAKALAEPTPLPADGGLPIISGSHWLELELQHWRTQLRQWMTLPVLASR